MINIAWSGQRITRITKLELLYCKHKQLPEKFTAQCTKNPLSYQTVCEPQCFYSNTIKALINYHLIKFRAFVVETKIKLFL